jgi:N6-adenosine-specific RNA methylase IME4
MIYTDFDAIPRLRYGLIMADPPWSFDNWSAAGEAKNAKAKYACQGIEWIKSLPVGHLAAPDCMLWLWATNPMLPDALDALRAWGFTFKTAGHWVKRTKGGKLAFGTGYIFRCSGEPYLIGTIGTPSIRLRGVPGARSIRSVIEAPVREHSRKPDEAYEAAEILSGGAPMLEMFSRQPRAGWDTFGDEALKFREGTEGQDV